MSEKIKSGIKFYWAKRRFNQLFKTQIATMRGALCNTNRILRWVPPIAGSFGPIISVLPSGGWGVTSLLLKPKSRSHFGKLLQQNICIRSQMDNKSSFPSPVQTLCFQLSIFGILSLIGFLEVVFPRYYGIVSSSKNHLSLRSWPCDYVWPEICDCHFNWEGSTSAEVCCYRLVIDCSHNVSLFWDDAIASWTTTLCYKVDELKGTIGVIWQSAFWILSSTSSSTTLRILLWHHVHKTLDKLDHVDGHELRICCCRYPFPLQAWQQSDLSSHQELRVAGVRSRSYINLQRYDFLSGSIFHNTPQETFLLLYWFPSCPGPLLHLALRLWQVFSPPLPLRSLGLLTSAFNYKLQVTTMCPLSNPTFVVLLAHLQPSPCVLSLDSASSSAFSADHFLLSFDICLVFFCFLSLCFLDGVPNHTAMFKASWRA